MANIHTTQWKAIAWNRHAKAPQKPGGKGSYDKLVPGALELPYTNGKDQADFFKDIGADPYTTTIFRSPKNRTEMSGQGYAIGALGLKSDTPRLDLPRDMDDLKHFPALNLIRVIQEDDMIYHDPCWNEDVYNRDPTGREAMQYWLEHPEATQHLGKEIESGSNLRKRTGDISARIINQVLHTDDKLAIATTHIGVLDPILWNLYDSAAHTPLANLDEIGGPSEMGETALQVIGIPKSGNTRSYFKRGDHKYHVNLENFFAQRS